MKNTLICLSICLIFIGESFGQEANWGSWSTSPCYKGIEFRVKDGRIFESSSIKKQYYHVEIKNNYNGEVNFSYSAGTSRETAHLSKHGASGISNGEVKEMYFIYEANKRLWVWVGNLKFVSSDDFYACDGF